MTNQTKPNHNKNPICWAILHKCHIHGVYTRPDWAAKAVLDSLRVERDQMLVRAQQFKLMHPREIYALESGYAAIESGEPVSFVENPTEQDLTNLILLRTSNNLSTTTVGIGGSTYALDVCPLELDA